LDVFLNYISNIEPCASAVLIECKKTLQFKGGVRCWKKEETNLILFFSASVH